MSQQDLNAFADWLVANQSKRGTPEFETVASAFRELDAQLGQRDGAFAYSVDRMQRMGGKGIEAFGELVGSQDLSQAGSNIVQQQDQDIAAGGYQPQYGNSLTSYIGTDNFFPALGEKVLENLAPGGAAIAGTGAAIVASIMGAPIIGLGIGGATLGGSVLLETGASAEEQEERTGDYDPATAATVGAIAGILDKVGAGKVIPKDKLAQMTVGQVAEELTKKGKGEAAAAFVAQVARSARGEALTELGQEGLQVAGAMTQGADYTAQELVERGGDALMLGGTMGGGARAAIDTTGAVGGGISRIFGGGNSAPADPEAAAELAQRLQTIAEGGGPDGKPEFNLNDVDRMSQTGARAVVEAAHVDIAEDIKQAVADLKDRLKVKDTDDASSVLQKVAAQAAVRMARNKTKSVITSANFDAVRNLAGDTLEGQRLLSLIRQSNELTAIHNSGYQGGVSRITDQFSPIGSQASYDRGFSTIESTIRPIAALGAGVMNPVIPAAQAAAVGVGRGIDALTGRRSRVRRYIEQNAGQPGIQIQEDAPSLRQQRIDEDNERKAQLEAQKAAEALQTADNKAMHKSIYEANGRFYDESPQQMLLDGLGLSPQRAVQLLKDIAKNNQTFARTARKAINAIQNGGYIPSMRYIGPKMKSELDKDQPRVARDRPVFERRLEEGIQRSAAIQQGINDNRDFNDQLKDALNADRNIDNQSKAVANAALDDLRRDLGKTPVSRAEQIEADAIDKATDPMVVRNYVTPYVDRVRKQQGAEDVVSNNPVIEPFLEMRLPEEKAPRRQHREIGEMLMAEQAQRYGRDLDPYNDGGDFETVAQAMTEEAQFQLDKTPNAADWYDNDIKLALQRTGELIPEINQSENNRQLYLLLAAITSIGHKPKINWRYAGSLAMHYFHTGDIGERGKVFSEKRGTSEDRTVNPTTGKVFGLKASSIEPGINIIDHMVKKMGVEATLDWVNSPKTKKEIDAMRKEAGYGPQGKIKGGMNAVVPGIQMFGPKVGPFYMNLNGIHEVTVDVWASRTVRRHTGGLLNPLYDPANKKSGETGLVDAPTELERPTMKNIYSRVGENLGVTPQAAQAILWAYEQELYNDLGADSETQRFSEGAEEFAERDAVAYAERYPRFAARQDRGRTRDGSSPTIEGSRQYTFDFGDTEPGRPQSDPGRQNTAPLVGSKPATPEQIREVKPATDAMFEIGKPGGEFEDGIRDLDTAKKLGQALGAAVYIVNNKAALGRVFGRSGAMGGSGSVMQGGAMMSGDPRKQTRNPKTGDQVRAVVGVLGEYKNPRQPQEDINEREAVFNALHEIAHVIESSFVPGETTTKPNTRYHRYSDRREARSNRLYENTFRQAIASLMDAAAGLKIDGYTPQDAKEILDEIVALQRKGVLDDGKSPIRGTYNIFNEAIDEAEAAGNPMRARSLELQLMKAEDTYFQTPQELAADLIGFYLYHPIYAKRIMPKATKLVRDIMNSSKVVTFYSMPLASLVAIIFANMLVGEQEEEDQRGALALGQGALSA